MHGNYDVMGRLVRARREDDGSLSVKRGGRWENVAPTADVTRIDTTTDQEIEAQIAEDDAEAARDSAAWARRVRRRTGLSQAEFARRIALPVAMVRGWERDGVPHGPAGTLLRVIDRAPEVAMAVLAA